MFTVKAPAKINWSLIVGDKREDGYHSISSLMQCVGLYDTLTFEEPGSLSDNVELISGPAIPPEQNLVMKAAELLRTHAGIKRGVRITLEKDIPSGAGLGGGSSDAAHTLLGLNSFWGLGLRREELKLLGGMLGSDVPFFFDAPLALVSGRGEVLAPLVIHSSHPLLLVKPRTAVSTPWAYAELDSARARHIVPESKKEVDSTRDITLIYEALASCNILSIKSLLHNDFEDVVFGRYPEIGEIKGRLIECGAVAALMSGSGSTVFGLFENKGKAFSASAHFSGSVFFSRVADTLITS